MNNTNYEKPKMKFVSLRNKKEVANTCWGGHGNKMTWFYDTQGTGYVSFQIGGGECTLNLSNVKYYENKESQGENIDQSNEKYNELHNALMKSGGESGNPFKNEGVNFFPEPKPEWS